MLISQLLQVSPRLLYRKQMLLPLACIAGKPIAIYCNPDHTHLPVSIKPVNSIAGVVRDIKSFSGRYINENRLVKGHFEWQTGYGAFSYSQSQIEQVKVYIRNQYNHHKKITFRDEYVAFLKVFRINYDDSYLFDWID